MKLKHNCTKEGKFRFVALEGFEDNEGNMTFKDKIQCLICERIWEEQKHDLE